MKTLPFTTAVLIFSATLPAMAQHHGHAHHAGNTDHGSSYAGMQNRGIKALSRQQIDGLRAGKGMGTAMPAELNGYPGPLHVLELASQLELSDAQIARTKQLYAEMQARAIAAGEEVIAAERELDALFREKRATAKDVSSAVSSAALAQGKLRETHLRYHLVMMEILSADQVAAYNRLRGY